MKRNKSILVIAVLFLLAACNTAEKRLENSFLTAKEAVLLNQLVYKDSIESAFSKHAPEYEVVYKPEAVDGNFAFIAKKKNTLQYALVVRGSVMEFSNEGFQNFILQDFNIFKMKEWAYTDTVQKAYISNGAWIGFQNLIKLKDISSGLSLKDFIEQNIPKHSSIVITGHSLGGNLAYPLAGYLKKELDEKKKLRLQLITFGAPAVGNASFVQDMEEKYPDAERYAADKDIAAVFPDLDEIGRLAKITGLDSVLHLGEISINGTGIELNTGVLLDVAGAILEKTNLIDKSSKYVQSKKHLRPLMNKEPAGSDSVLSAEIIFGRIYQYHRIDGYAELMGVKPIK